MAETVNPADTPKNFGLNHRRPGHGLRWVVEIDVEIGLGHKRSQNCLVAIAVEMGRADKMLVASNLAGRIAPHDRLMQSLKFLSTPKLRAKRPPDCVSRLKPIVFEKVYIRTPAPGELERQRGSIAPAPMIRIRLSWSAAAAGPRDPVSALPDRH